MKIFDQDCDLLENDFTNCLECYRYDICNKWFKEHPNEIYCADDTKRYLTI